MTWKVKNPSSSMIEMACDLFNRTKASDLPAPSGMWGLDAAVWKALIDLTYTNCKALGIPTTNGGLKGMCIWGSVVTAKFYVHKFAYINSRVIRVEGVGDHYFVSVKGATQAGICDVTCNQFGAPDFIAGSLTDVKGQAQKVQAGGGSLYGAYALGAGSDVFVL
ncbi:hypothetical protein [Niveibacterium sp. SC-1]|uniref:hypothetical protein n=1 Tax=Niveibacterium sp. SC-1 TaxID=3135646 RepID=UPI00311DAE86